ncbi:MAG: S1C family serine protease [Aggregatilineales bacterium]
MSFASASRSGRATVALVVVLLLTALAAGSVPAFVGAQSEDVTIPSDQVFTDVYERVSPSVVSINVVARRPQTGAFGQDGTVISGGTGFVLDSEGHIMTNNHVVEGATEIEVSFVDGTLASARVVGLDPDSDLAVLQVELPAEDLARLRPVTFGDSSALRIGQTVLAIGSPFGQRWTLTSGIVSALDRSIRGLTNYSIGGVIQTDAAINPGNSGGPLLDLNGRVVGVNSQIISSTRSSAGIGFAVPGNLAQRVARALIENGFVSYSYLGITGGNVTLSLIKAFNLPNNTQGVVVAETAAGGPASRAGLRSAEFEGAAQQGQSRVPLTVDIITAIGGQPLKGMDALISYLAEKTEPGQTVKLTVMRLTRESSETLELEARLTPRP